VSVLVTGANGFVGQRLCADLLEVGRDLRGVVRRHEAVNVLPDGVESLVLRQLNNADMWQEVLAGVDSVVHLIGRAHVLRETSADPLADYRATNVGITCSLLDACRASGVRHLVFMSSIGAVGRGAEVRYEESSPCAPEDPYGVSKREAEELVLDAGKDGNMVTTVLRPPLVYGPRVKGNFLRLLALARRGLPLPLGCVRNARSMVFVGNLTNAVEAVLRASEAASGVFHVADPGEPLSTANLVQKLAQLMERPARLVPFPVSLMRLGGRVLGRTGDVERLTRSLVVSTHKLQEELRWEPPYSVDQGLAETIDWYMHQRAQGQLR